MWLNNYSVLPSALNVWTSISTCRSLSRLWFFAMACVTLITEIGCKATETNAHAVHTTGVTNHY
jgi:hypothetical protein